MLQRRRDAVGYVQLIGWTSAALLVATIVTQIFRQWRAGTSDGVSRFLFIGQFLASTGLGIYSYLGREWVFLTLNILMAATAVAGLVVWWVHHRRHRTAVATSSTVPRGPILRGPLALWG